MSIFPMFFFKNFTKNSKPKALKKTSGKTVGGAGLCVKHRILED